MYFYDIFYILNKYEPNSPKQHSTGNIYDMI